MSFTRGSSGWLQGKAIAMSRQESPYALHKEQYEWVYREVSPPTYIFSSTLLLRDLNDIIAHRSLTWEELE